MKTARLFLGPPCSGKSTASLALGWPRFSVRHWYEAKRREENLPPVGTFLQDEMIFRAVEHFLSENARAQTLAFDGFPGNASQFLWLQKRLEKEWQIETVYLNCSFSQARQRCYGRLVCQNCDGGADPVIPSNEGCCPVCGSMLSRRSDDVSTGFFRRWDQFFERFVTLRPLLPNSLPAIPIYGRMDLHLHTTASDGTQTPEKAIEQAKNLGLRLCAVTDHDTLDGLEEAEAVAHRVGIDFLRGVEVTATWEENTVHLLCYGFDLDNPALQAILRENQHTIERYDRAVLKLAHREGLLTEEAVAAFDDYCWDAARGGWKLLNFFKDQGLCTNGFDFLARLECLHAAPKQYVSAQRAILVLRTAGVCVLAHPGAYCWAPETLEAKLETFLLMGIQGVECFHPLHPEEFSERCSAFCLSHGLLEFGGSDDHGNLPERFMGTPYLSRAILQIKQL